MKVKFLGQTSFCVLTHGKIYDVLSIEKDWYRIVVDPPLSEDYLFAPELFQVVESSEIPSSGLIKGEQLLVSN